jgi:hypothetical protein
MAEYEIETDPPGINALSAKTGFDPATGTTLIEQYMRKLHKA